MNIQRYVVRLYPRNWRERYEDEVLAMLEQRPLSFADGVNLFFGALDAQLHPRLGTTGMAFYERILAMFLTLRRSLLTIFCAYIGFILAGAAAAEVLWARYRDRGGAWLLPAIGFALPFSMYAAILGLAAIAGGGLWWNVDVGGGAVFFAGLTGFLLALLAQARPPAREAG